jgi:hypothetical protein
MIYLQNNFRLIIFPTDAVAQAVPCKGDMLLSKAKCNSCFHGVLKFNTLFIAAHNWTLS